MILANDWMILQNCFDILPVPINVVGLGCKPLWMDL
jgi:hypothetical protein